MGTTLCEFDDRFVGDIIRIYNKATASEPFIVPLSEELLHRSILDHPAFDPAGLLVAVKDGCVAGWVHLANAYASEEWQDLSEPVPRICMLAFAPDDLGLGNLLVAEATSRLRSYRKPWISAMDPTLGYPFYRGLWMGGEPMIPARLPSLQMAFASGGYRTVFESVLLYSSMTSAPAPSGPEGLSMANGPFQSEHAHVRDSWVGQSPMLTTAALDGTVVGRVGWLAMGGCSSRVGSPVLAIWSLSVDEAHRKKGIGAALVAHSMALGYEVGCRSAIVGTGLHMAAAHFTYLRVGFRPETLMMGRRLQNDARETGSAS